MGAALPVVCGITPYEMHHAPQVLALAREMHAESAMSAIPLAEDKLLDGLRMATVNQNVYLRLWMRDGVVIGGLWGMLVSPYWSHEKVAADRAWFVHPGRRGGIAAVMILRDFEAWAKKRGVRWVMPGQTTGVRMDDTRRLFERCGYRVIGSNFMKEMSNV